MSTSSAKVRAASSVATKAWPAARCAFIAAPSAPPPMVGPVNTHGLAAPGGFRDLRGHHLRARRHDELDGVLERLAGTREQDVGRAGADVDGEDARGRARVGAPAARAAPAPPLTPAAGRRLLKRSFQTLVMASSTMSLLILLSPTLRSTKMMGSSTTLKPSLYAR